MPAALVLVGNRQGWKGRVVDREDSALVGIGIDVTDVAKRIRIGLGSFRSLKEDSVIAAQARGLVDVAVSPSAVVETAFGTNHQEGQTPGEGIETSEVDVVPIHDVEVTGLEQQLVDGTDIVNVGGCDADKTRDAAAQVHSGIELSGPAYQHLGDVDTDAPVSSLVGVGHGASGDSATDAGMIELRLHGADTFPCRAAFPDK